MKNKDKRKITIKEKVAELEKIVKYFQEEEIDLDIAIDKYEKADDLVKEISEVLKGYETKIEKISASTHE
ncbi:exodeoxyribonuclease VII small subunit [Candidatus Dojkabacteria bacterium]|nr:exodeoxyribonuclease VII small subunit [Candidatus Dojkabacteria bacterium]